MEPFISDWWWSRQSLARKGLRIFRFCVMPWKDKREPTIKYCLGGQVDVVQKFTTIQNFGTIDGEPMEFEWNIFPGFTTLQLSHKVQEFLSKMSDQPEQFKGRIIFMSMFNDISWGSEDNEQECESNANLVSLLAKRFPAGRRSFLGLGPEKKRHPTDTDKTNLEKEDTQFSDPRVHYLEERSKAKVVDNCQYTSALMRERLKLFFAQMFLVISSVSTEPVSDLCEEYKSCHGRTGRPVLVGQSDPLFVPTSSLMKTPTLSTDDLAQEDLLQKYQERVDKLSQQNRVIKICMDAGFLTTVDVGQYFMTKDTE